MKRLIGLIPAAGKGVRAYPYTKSMPKSMLKINGVPNLEKNICIMRDQLNIREIIIIIGYRGDLIRAYFGNGDWLGVSLVYVQNDALEKGLAYSILLARPHINDYFCIMLSDECYINSNHCDLLKLPFRDHFATLAMMHVDDQESIKKNYSVVLNGAFIETMIEKPRSVSNDILGCGTFIFHPAIFQHLAQAYEKTGHTYVELITFLSELCQKDHSFYAFPLRGTYVNINDRNSLNLAKYHERNQNFEHNRISLLVYAEGNEKDIAFTLKRYKAILSIESIFVVLPHQNSIADIVHQNGATRIVCPPHLKLYGEKLKYAMDRLPGEIFILSEAEYSFPSRDILKLLAYLREADMVVGTRTTRQLIEQGSSMRGIVRFANVVLGKLLEVLWWQHESRFTDVGCTFRAIWRSSFENIAPELTARGPEFGAEMIIEVLRKRDRVIEIPVNYHNRSQAMHVKYQNTNTFFRILFLILKKSLCQKWRGLFYKSDAHRCGQHRDDDLIPRP